MLKSGSKGLTHIFHPSLYLHFIKSVIVYNTEIVVTIHCILNLDPKSNVAGKNLDFSFDLLFIRITDVMSCG